MANKKRQYCQECLLLLAACFFAFTLGLGAAWWLTDGQADPVPRNHAATSLNEPESKASPPRPTTPTRQDTASSRTGALPTPLPPLPPEDNPLQTLNLTAEDIPISGSGNFQIAAGSSIPTGNPETNQIQKYRVEVEEGLPFDAEQSAVFIDEVLADSRSWSGQNRHHFQRVSDDTFDFRILIASPDTVDELCAPLNTNGIVSCGRAGRATLNALRWGTGVGFYGDDLENYRRYLINHEVGHLLGYPHEGCPGAGQPAPLMMQQSLSLGQCEPNPWPYPKTE